MSQHYWDPPPPDHSKLPAHIREGMQAPMPLQDGETYATIHIFSKHKGNSHPRGRLNSTPWTEGNGPPKGVYIDIRDFTGKVNVAAIAVDTKDFAAVIYKLMLTYLQSGGTWDTLEKIFQDLNPNKPQK